MTQPGKVAGHGCTGAHTFGAARTGGAASRSALVFACIAAALVCVLVWAVVRASKPEGSELASGPGVTPTNSQSGSPLVAGGAEHGAQGGSAAGGPGKQAQGKQAQGKQGAGASTAPTEKIDAIVNAALELRTRQEYGQSEAVLRSAIAQYPGEQVLYVQLGELLALQRKSKEAHAEFERAIAIGPSDAAIELAAGTAANDAGLTQRAMEHFGAAQAADKTDWQAPLFLAQVQIKTGELAEAKKNLLIAAQIKPELAVAWGSLAELQLRENSVGPALQSIAHAREIEPASVVWRLIEARALKRDKKPAQALELLVGLADSDKLQPGVLGVMGECYGLLGKPAECAAEYARVSDAFPTKAELALEAARWYERAKSVAEAKKYAQRAQYLGDADGKALAERLSAAESK